MALTVGSPSFDRRGTMLKHYAFMLLFLLGSLNVWGEEASLSSVSTQDVTAQGKAGQNTSVSKEFSGVTCTVTKKSNNTTQPGFYTKSGIVRYYSGDEMTLSVASGNNITAITFVMNSGTVGTASVGTLSQDNLSWSGSAQSVTFTGGATVKIKSIAVTYSTGGSSQPTLSVEPATIDFGTVEQGAPVESKTVAVSFENLTGSVTYSGLTSPFSANGTISSTGDEITIAANTATIGEYSQTLTVQSADDNKSAEVTVKINVVEPFNGLALTFPDYNNKSVSGYTYSWTATKSGQVWTIDNFNNNSNGWSLIKAGRDGKASVASITTQVKDHAVSDVTVTIDGVTASKINSHKLYVADNSSFTDAIEIDGNPAAIATGDIVYTVPVANRDNDLYYKLEYDCASGTANGFLQISKITYAYAEATPQKQNAGLAYDAADAQKLAKVAGTLTAPTLTNPNSLTITYASSNTDVVEVNASTGAITAIKAAGKAVITASSEEDATYKAGSATYTIFVATEAGTAENPLTEASAKALIDDGCTLNVNVKGTVSAVGSLNTNYGSISLTLTDGFQFYGMLNTSGVQFTENPFAVGDVVTAVGNLKKHNTTYELDLNCQLVERIPFAGSKTSIANTKETAYTVAQALAYAADPTTYDLTDHVYIAGVVYQVNSFNSTNGTYNIYIKDAGTSEDDGKFEFYKCSGLYEVGGTPAQFEEGDVQIGDEVIGYGVMTYFSGGSIWEFGQPNQLVSLNRPTVPVTSINLTESTATVEEGKTVTLHASVLPNNATDQDIEWTVVSGDTYASVDNGVVTGIAAGEAVIRAASHEEASIYAECTVTVTEPAPLSPWASVYTSNVTVGKENYTIKILKPGSTTEYDEFEGMRYGTGDAPGVATITIPANTQALHFHAAAWNTENVTLEVKVGEETYPLTFGELVKEANIKGNGTTYQLSTPIDEYYMLDLSSYTIADNTVITFTATGGKRFVLYGVNQEGGIVPVLDHIVVTGTATELEYEVGDVFNPAGLGANAIYTLGGVELEPVAIDAKDIEWSFEPATIAANTTSVTVTATYEGKNDQTNVPVTVTVPEPEIIVSAASLAFNNVAKGVAVADKELTVTLKSVENATLTITGDGASAFSVTPAALTASGTVAVSASSANVGTFNATLTISDDAGEAEAKTVALSITVEASDDLSGTWNLVTDAAELMPGMQVIIASVADGEGNLYTLGGPNGTSANNRLAVASTATGTVLHPEAGTKVITLVDAGNGKYALQLVNGNYLCAAGSGTNNYLKEADDYNSNKEKWTITIADNKAKIQAASTNRNTIRYNSGNSIFSCYAENGQAAIALYAKPFDYTRNVSGNYATICLPKAGQIIGATLYEIAYYGETSKKIFFDEIVNGEMEAGIPYIFQPAAGVEKINVYYSDNTAENVEARDRNGLIGFYNLTDPAATHNITQDAGFYILYNNQYWLVSGRAAYVENYRAYIELNQIDPSEPTLAPGRRRISMSVNDTQTTTGFENGELINGENGVQKVLIDGELFILRGEKMYDAKGQLVK